MSIGENCISYEKSIGLKDETREAWIHCKFQRDRAIDIRIKVINIQLPSTKIFVPFTKLCHDIIGSIYWKMPPIDRLAFSMTCNLFYTKHIQSYSSRSSDNSSHYPYNFNYSINLVQPLIYNCKDIVKHVFSSQ